MESTYKQFLATIHGQKGVLRERYHVQENGIFGSVARGEHSGKSDIDVLVEFSEPVGFFAFLDLEDFLSNLLGKKVDLVTKRALKSAVKNRILKDTIYA